jgi:hypothetical protein
VKPRVLVATTSRWFSTARLVMALAKAGCAVEVICPDGHPVGKTSAAHRMYEYRGLRPLASFANAIAAANPDLLIPGDDLATQHLHSLYERERRCGKGEGAICRLIERSLGAPESFQIVYGRTAVMELARAEGVRVPETRIIKNTDDLKNWASRSGFPFILKADRTSGGTGVKVVHTFEEAERAFRSLQAPPRFKRAVRQALSEHDTTLLWPSLLRQRRTVNAQAFIAGREATSTVVCWQGRLLASLHFEILHTAYSAGPATVVRLIENSEISLAAEKVVRRLSLSGFQGFDFLIEGNSDSTYLIEMNPRVTQAGHLTLGPGRDLPAALFAAISGEALILAPKITEDDTIAFFPQEWLRNPESPYLLSGFHDVPWDEPEFVRACVRDPAKLIASFPERKTVPTFSPVRLPRT